jgi:NAD(P)-dependent dehydrogenase (short-subunit alcohol dehydrogenase family)
MAAKTILLTGSTDGIGKATACILAQQGHRVLLHGRNTEKGRAVLQEMRDLTGSDRLDLFIADLSMEREVRGLADTIEKAYDRLDVLINNAGVFMPERTLAPGDIEMTFAVNFLAPFLLTHELLPLLKRSAPARIVNTASIAHRRVRRIDWDTLPEEENYDPYQAYALSKLGVVAFTYRLARALGGTRVTANCLHPGVIDTKLLRAYTGEPSGGAPPEQGAEVEVYVATSPALEEVSGQYFEEKEATRPSSLSLDPAVQERFCRVGMEFTGASGWL